MLEGGYKGAVIVGFFVYSMQLVIFKRRWFLPTPLFLSGSVFFDNVDILLRERDGNPFLIEADFDFLL